MHRLVIAVVLLVAAAPLYPQATATRSLPSVEFSFGNPGARSLGMGGAFLALADDASAAESNPAGLTTLRKPEVSVELRNSTSTTDIPIRGTFPDIERGPFSTSSHFSQIAFASVVVPLQRVSLAAYYHRVAGFRVSNFLAEPVVFSVGAGGAISPAECARLGASCSTDTLPAESANLAADVETSALAAATAFGRFSVGGALRVVSYSQGGTIIPFDTEGRSPGTFSQTADGRDVTFSVGLKWKATENISVGGVYKSGSQFDAPVTFQPIGRSERILISNVQREFPSVAGAGLSIRAVPSLTLNIDAIRIGYAKFGRSVLRAISTDDPRNYRLDDGTELHAGAEYFILTKVPIGIRAGWWRDPAHSLEYIGPANTVTGVAGALIYPHADPQDHYSAGVGLSWSRFSVDAAYDASADDNIASLSLVARF